MCKCTPGIRTPFCGKPGCEWPEQKVQTLSPDQVEDLETGIKLLRQERDALRERVRVLEAGLREACDTIEAAAACARIDTDSADDVETEDALVIARMYERVAARARALLTKTNENDR